MWCQVHSSHSHSPLIKHLITTTANKHPGKKSLIDKNKKNPTGIKLCISHQIVVFATTRPPNHQTTKPPDHQTTKPPNHQTTRPPNHQTTRPPNHQTTKPPNHQTTKPPNHQTTQTTQKTHTIILVNKQILSPTLALSNNYCRYHYLVYNYYY